MAPKPLGRRPRVYISGTISKGNWGANFAKFAEAHHELMEGGFAVLNPGLTMRLPKHAKFSHARWLENDLPWVEVADMLVRLPGESGGADIEAQHAKECGVEVVAGPGAAELAVAFLKQGQLWCQGHSTCPMKHRHRWPGQFIGGDSAGPYVGSIRKEAAEAGLLPPEASPPAPGAAEQPEQPAVTETCEQPDAADVAERLAAICEERGLIYGPPLENHAGIAQMWAPMLQPHSQAIGDQQPLPPHVVALMMALLKIDRMRLRFHADNYDDVANYLAFAREWQETGADCKETIKKLDEEWKRLST